MSIGSAGAPRRRDATVDDSAVDLELAGRPRSWKLRRSVWLLWILGSCGFLGPVGFVWVASQMKQRRATVIAAVVTVYTVALFVVVSLEPERAADDEGTSLAGLLLIIGFVAQMVAGPIVNQWWLRWQVTVGPWYTRAVYEPLTGTVADDGGAALDTAIDGALAAPPDEPPRTGAAPSVAPPPSTRPGPDGGEPDGGRPGRRLEF